MPNPTASEGLPQIVSPKNNLNLNGRTRINVDSTADSINKIGNSYNRKRESNVSTGSKALKLPVGNIKNGQEVILHSNEYTLTSKDKALGRDYGNDYHVDDNRLTMDKPVTIGTIEDNSPSPKISLKERSTTNWRDKKILDD